MKNFFILACLAWALITPQLLSAEGEGTGNITDFAGGTGVELDPYLIQTADHLNNVRSFAGNATTHYYFELLDDIDLGAWLADPGRTQDIQTNGWVSLSTFYGVLDGKNFTISGLWMSRTASGSNHALFAALGEGASISNLNVATDDQKGGIRGRENTGILAGSITAGSGVTITNCSVTGNVFAQSVKIGGLIGQIASGTVAISDCSAAVTVESASTSGEARVGGLIGWASGTNKIEDCHVLAGSTVSATGSRVGGLIGQVSGTGTNIINCSAKANITGARYAGGLVGYIAGSVIDNLFNVTGCSAEGNVTTTGMDLGGLIGYIQSGTFTISNCSASGTVSSSSPGDAGNTRAGGLIGCLMGTTATKAAIAGCSVVNSVVTAYDETSYKNNVGGLIGRFEVSEGSISNCTVEATALNGGTYVGGLVGIFSGSVATSPFSMTDCSAAAVTVTATGAGAGGLIGLFNKGALTASNCYAEGSITGLNKVGGLIGMINLNGGVNALSITGWHSQTTVIATIEGESDAGGLVGNVGGTVNPIEITSCYALGTVTGKKYTGGLFGSIRTNSTIQKCFASGAVTGTEAVGGFAGLIGGSATITIQNSYASGTVTGTIQVGGLIGTHGGSTNTSIKECYVINNIENTGSQTGGLTGSATSATSLAIEDCVIANSAILATGTGIGNINGSPKNNATTLSGHVVAYNGIVYNEGKTPSPNTATMIFNAPTDVSKADIVSPSAYPNWDFDDTWEWSDNYYRLPVLKNMNGQANTQPEHLPLNNDVTLSQLSLSKGVLTPELDETETDYTASVIYIVENIDITAIANDENAILTGDTGIKSLNVGENTFTIEVLAEDQITKETYTIKVTRADETTDATLKGLTTDEGDLTPDFDPFTTEYTVTLPYPTEEVTLTATPNGDNATAAGDGLKALSVGNNPFEIEVTAEDGVTKETYKLTVIRIAPSTDATLADLTVDEGELSPIFNAATKEYTVSVTRNIESITITAEATDENATVAGTGTKALALGVNSPFEIEVTAEDGLTKETYTVTVTRLYADDATLKSLSVVEGVLAPVFNAATKEYTVSVTRNIESITITAEATDENATVEGDGTKDNLPFGKTTFDIVVTAEDGTTEETYSIEVNRLNGTAIDNVKTGEIRFSVQDRSIIITGAKGIVTLTSLTGISQKYPVNESVLRISVAGTGVYLLTGEGFSWKIVVK